MEKNIKHIPMVLFCLTCVKHLILPAEVTDIPGIIVLGVLTGLFQLVSVKKEKDEFKEQVDKLRQEIDKTKKIQEEILSGVTQLKLSQGFKAVSNLK